MQKVFRICLFDNSAMLTFCRMTHAAVAVGMLFSVPAIAQSDPPQTSPMQQAFCAVRSNPDLQMVKGGPNVIVAFCGNHGVILGPADEFSVIANENAKAILVDIRNNGARKILLVSDQGEDQPLFEDISGQISMGAGRGPVAPLEGIDIDLTSFANDGAISVTGRARAGDARQAALIDLKQQLIGVRAARLAATK